MTAPVWVFRDNVPLTGSEWVVVFLLALLPAVVGQGLKVARGHTVGNPS